MPTLNADLSWRTFAKTLLLNDEIDPKYIGLTRAGFKRDQMRRIAFGYVAFYHTGVAGWLSEFQGDDWWKAAERNFDILPRGSQRRHFRGALGRSTLRSWRESFGTPEGMMDGLLKQTPQYNFIRQWAEHFPNLGNYFIWKLCDLYEVLSEKSVDFSTAEAKHVHDSPIKGAKLVDPLRGVLETFQYMSKEMSGFNAPPYHNRRFDIQEAETVCCYMKRLREGSYVLGKHTSADYSETTRLPCDANARLGSGILLMSRLTPDYVDRVTAHYQHRRDVVKGLK